MPDRHPAALRRPPADLCAWPRPPDAESAQGPVTRSDFMHDTDPCRDALPRAAGPAPATHYPPRKTGCAGGDGGRSVVAFGAGRDAGFEPDLSAPIPCPAAPVARSGTSAAGALAHAPRAPGFEGGGLPAVGRVVICGTGIDAQALAVALTRRPGADLVGALVGSGWQTGCFANPRLSGAADRGVSVLRSLPSAALRDAAAFIGTVRPDSAILAMPEQEGPALAEFAARLSRAGIATFAAPRYAALVDPAGIADLIYPLSWTAQRTTRLRGRSGGDGPGFVGESVLVTGSGGTIGLELCRQLLAQGPSRIVLFEQGEYALDNALRELRALSDGTGIEIEGVLGSVCDGPLVGRIIRRFGVDSILHAAAYKHVSIGEEQPEAVFRNNTLGTATLAQRAQTDGVRRFVLVSTDKAVRPTGVMGASKRLAEMVVQDMATQAGETVFSIVRFGNVIGSSGSVVERFAEQIAFGGPVTLTDPAATRYFMTAEDAAGLVLSAARIAQGGEIFVLDMGRPHRIADIAKALIAASGRTDIPIVTTGLRPGEKLHEELGVVPGERVADDGPASRMFRLREPCLPPQSVAAMLRELQSAVESGAGAALMALARRWTDTGGSARGARASDLACAGQYSGPRRGIGSSDRDGITTLAMAGAGHR